MIEADGTYALREAGRRGRATGRSSTINRNGKLIAIIVSKDEYEGWQETVEIMRDPKFMAEIRVEELEGQVLQ